MDEKKALSQFAIVEVEWGNVRFVDDKQELHLYEVSISAPWMDDDVVHVIAESGEAAKCQASCRWDTSTYNTDELTLAHMVVSVKQVPLMFRGWSGYTF